MLKKSPSGALSPITTKADIFMESIMEVILTTWIHYVI